MACAMVAVGSAVAVEVGKAVAVAVGAEVFVGAGVAVGAGVLVGAVVAVGAGVLVGVGLQADRILPGKNIPAPKKAAFLINLRRFILPLASSKNFSYPKTGCSPFACRNDQNLGTLKIAATTKNREDTHAFAMTTKAPKKARSL